ncbi:phospholipase A and acyltransferase 4-like [Myripristis murdjan]|uniref:phospholipase A and acyltransferase 4-like n=1 Tax=Myripristis murdjan TaxID=586833 RepID=UPI0011764234|nr:phospholipase A and acyltransferase 4-like [Myripristis murdjan]
MAPVLFEKEPKPGDLIEIFRGPYEHWAVYIGGNEVVHMIPPSEDSGFLSSLVSVLESDMAEVKREKVWDVVGPHSFRVNNLLDDECHPRQPGVIVRDACRTVGQVLPYNVATHNCEHFVTELRYGKPESRQVRSAAEAVLVGTAAAAALGVLVATLFRDNSRRRRYDE